jgi:hemerythrin
VKHFLVLYNSSQTEIDDELFTFLKQWLTQHILQEDKAYTSFFNGCGIY